MSTPIADGKITVFFGGHDTPIGIAIAYGDELRLTKEEARELLDELAARLLPLVCGECGRRGLPAATACGSCGAAFE